MAFRFYQAKEGDLVHSLRDDEWYLLTKYVHRKNVHASDAHVWMGWCLKRLKQIQILVDWDVYGVQNNLNLYRQGSLVPCQVPPT